MNSVSPAVLPRTSTTAIVSLIFGVLTWIMLPLIGALVAVICGHAARGEIARSQGQLDGRGIATTGLILGWAHLALWIAGGLLVMSLPFGLFGAVHGVWHFLQNLSPSGCDNSTFHL